MAFGDNLLVPSSRVSQSKKNCWSPEDGTDWLSLNVGWNHHSTLRTILCRADLKVANVVEEILELFVKCWMQETRLLNVQFILTTSSAFSGHLNFQFFWFYCFEGISESADGHVLNCQCLSNSCFVNTKLLNFCTAKYPPRNGRGFINTGIAAWHCHSIESRNEKWLHKSVYLLLCLWNCPVNEDASVFSMHLYHCQSADRIFLSFYMPLVHLLV